MNETQTAPQSITISMEPLARRAEELEAQARQLTERAAHLAGQAEGLREAARLITAQAAPPTAP